MIGDDRTAVDIEAASVRTLARLLKLLFVLFLFSIVIFWTKIDDKKAIISVDNNDPSSIS